MRTQPSIRSITLAPDLSQLALARKLAAEVAAEAGFPEGRVFDISLVCSEAAANAIEHAQFKDQVEVKTLLYPNRLEIQVAGPGEFQAPQRLKERVSRGLGLPLMATLSDHLALYSGPAGGTLVSLTFYLPGASQEDEREPLPPSVREIIESNELISSITDNAPVGIYVLGADLRFRWANRAFQQFLEEPYRSLDLTGRHFTEVIPGAAEAGLMDKLRAISEKGVRDTAEEFEFRGFERGVTYWRWEALPLKSGQEDPPYDILAVLTDVTPRTQAEQRSARSEQSLGLAQRAARAGFWYWDVTNNSLSWDPVLYKLFGLDPECDQASFESWRRVLHPEDEAAASTRIQAALDEHTMLSSEYRIILPDGSIRWIYATGEGVYDEAGTPIRMLGLCLDITERKLAEEAASQLERRRAFLLEVVDRLRPLHDPIAVQETAARALGEQLGAERVAYFEVNGTDYVVERDYASSVSHIPGRFPVASFGKQLLAVFRSGRTAVSNDVYEDGLAPEEREAFDGIQTRAYIGVPLVKGRKLVAGLAVHSSRPRAWTPEEVRLVEAIAERTWSAVERARAESALRDREAAYRQSEESLKLALAAGRLATWDWQAGTNEIAWNDEHYRILGYEPGEVKPSYEAWMARVHPEDRSALEAALARATREGGRYMEEFRAAWPDGTVCWLVGHGYVDLDDEGRAVRSYGVIMDMSGRKAVEAERERQIKLEEALARETYARSLIEASLDPLVVIGRDGTITDVNEATVKMTGWARDELIGTDFSDYFADPEGARQGYLQVFALGSVSDYPLTIRDREGKLTDVFYNASVFHDDKGEVQGVFAAARDVSGLKELAQQRDIAAMLQNALIGVPKLRRGVRFAHSYRSATESARVGGDFYDVLQVRDGRTALLIGDVAGHGVEAARTATLVRDVLHAFTYQSLSPEKVLKRTNRLLVGREVAGFVTLFLGILDHGNGELRYASAGHPPVLLRRASGHIEELMSASSPLGIYADAAWRAYEIDLDPDDVLLLYTDGALEARRDGQFFGEERLAEVLRRGDVALDCLPDAVVDEVLTFSRGVLRDDIAVLAVALDLPPGQHGPRRSCRQTALLD